VRYNPAIVNRLRRILLNTAAAVSLLLCLAAAGDWIGSRGRFSYIWHGSPSITWVIASDSGAIFLIEENLGGQSETRYEFWSDRPIGGMAADLGGVSGYDNLNRLTDFRRGTLSDANIDGVYDTVSTLNTLAGSQKNWSLDAVGNWNSSQTDGTTTSRTTNQQNQVTSVGVNAYYNSTMNEIVFPADPLYRPPEDRVEVW
jgi:hypothetical protein